jgi:hypothetical protein
VAGAKLKACKEFPKKFNLDSAEALEMHQGSHAGLPISPFVAMARSALCYRGLPYDHSHDASPSPAPIDHIYRGHHYDAPLRHEPSPVDEALDFVYRGTHYHHHHA